MPWNNSHKANYRDSRGNLKNTSNNKLQKKNGRVTSEYHITKVVQASGGDLPQGAI